MYNFIMYAMQLGVRIAARFDSKVRKMWRGEQAAFGVLQQRVDPDGSLCLVSCRVARRV